MGGAGLSYSLQDDVFNSAENNHYTPTTKPPFPTDDSVLLHPSTVDKLWTRITHNHIVRRVAYFDTRDPEHTAVAFISMHDDRQRMKPKIYAQLIYDRYNICSELEYWGHSGELDLKEDVRELYVHYLLRNTIKNISSTIPPNFARITIDSFCSEELSELISIKDTRKQQANLTYGVCLHKGLYDLNDPQLLLDWVELNIALGAEIITVYLQNVSESYNTIIRPYVEKGVVEVLDWKLHVPFIPEYTKHWGQTATVSECIFRNIYRVKYLGLIDVDEFFVPQKHLTIPKMLQALEIQGNNSKFETTASYLLYNAFMFNDGTSLPELFNASKCSNMKWPRYYLNTLRSSNPSRQYGYHKIIVRPIAVNTAWYHYIFAPWQKGYDKQYNVPIDLGLTHHYRIPEKRRHKSVQTFIMSKYFELTRRGITERMCSNASNT